MVEPPPEPRPQAPSQSRQTPEAGSPAPAGRDGERRRSKLAFGAREFVDAIAHRITEHLRRPELEEPLVVGVFGEWGSGKSRVLAELEEHFRQRAEAAGEDQPLTLPVFFNAWRFEAEEHLIIPLLKTAEHKILDWQEGRRSKGKKALEWLRQKAEILEQASIALFYGLKGKLAVPQVAEISFDPGASLDAAKERWKEIEAHRSSPIQEMASLYYDFQTHMEKLTGRQDDHPGLNLVFLVDDLDRCLPEKAVQMLESIKLFLEVEGCVFVLAVDDEVVSRGISHRYRDYNENAQGAYDSIAYSLDPDRYDTFQGNRPPRLPPPITGAEYLEKIIHLPFRISRPSRLSVEAFLRDRYPELFVGERVEASLAEVDGDVASEAGDRRRDTGKLAGGKGGAQGRADLSGPLDPAQAEQLLDFFSFCVPAVPRKLIRAAELYKMLARVARRRGWDDFDPLLLARTVLLQLLAPDLYRFGRGVPTFLAVMRRWSDEVKPLSLPAIERHLGAAAEPTGNTRTGDAPDGGEGDAEEPAMSRQDRHLRETRDRPLLARLRDVARQRSGFDPFRMVHSDFPLSEENLLYYYRLRAEEPEPAAKDRASEVPEKREARLDDAQEFVLQLTSTDSLAWRNAVESEAERLRDRVLDSATFGELRQHAGDSPEAIDVEWLSTLEPHLTGEQLAELYKASRLLPRLSADVTEEGRPS